MNRRETVLNIKTSGKSDMVDITGEITSAVRESGVRNGICMVYIPHTTCAVTINENADPAVKHDIMAELDKIVPWKDAYHHMEGNSAAHIKSSMFGFSQTIPITEGALPLGTWQGIYLCEFDGPRSRTVSVQIFG
ncbi:secondary thiamine-phosphate synthase enzyme YjbQ [Sediminispirochaeta bajacaliforniensis]|uniref:secondary thiamine-phosphate synthase enzyme YjbQ n=1 Tax=Sediminispirochaeta bajacaliforniensis TaxID=148 RepID=UPI000374148C|nr:secondary thiamine-phosphate synthase enzyme YjbQ [Sediminispirochaeta bajacaliforniensis]